MLPVLSPASLSPSLASEGASATDPAEPGELGDFGTLLGILNTPAAVVFPVVLSTGPEAEGGDMAPELTGRPLPTSGRILPGWLLGPPGEDPAGALPAPGAPRLWLTGQRPGLLPTSALAETLQAGMGATQAGARVGEFVTGLELAGSLSNAAQGARPLIAPALPGLAATPLPLNTPDFDQALGQRLLAFVHQGLQDARLRVHPEHLGPIEIRLRVEGEALQLSMASPHANVREALESALPRLRDTLAEAGIGLGQADVRDGGDRREAADDQGRSDGRHDASGEPQGAHAAAQAGDGSLTARRLALVDTFA
jgi:flagellar hook-length control protein FliK